MRLNWASHLTRGLALIVVFPCNGLWAVASDPVRSPDTISMDDSNPFFAPSSLPFHAPDFAAVKVEHFMPAFDEGMRQQLAQMDEIANQAAPPTLDNTLIAMERSGEILDRVAPVFFHLSGAYTNDAIQKLEEEIAPKLASHSDNIYLNRKLFQRVETLWKGREQGNWSEEQKRLVEKYYENFVRAGARLTADQQARIRAINEELSTLTTQFQNNLLAVAKERSLLIEDVSKLEGLSASDLSSAKQGAAARGHEGKYLLSMQNTTRQPVLTSLKNRETRKAVWLASANRAMGEAGGIDNRPIVLKLAKLRAERAKLLGYANHAAYTLENQMAENPQAAFKMLQDLVPGVMAKARIESEKILEAMRADGIDGPVEPWDWEYYAERVRARDYSVDETAVKPYFEMESVLQNGVFYAYGKLYGISFRERKDLPVWDPTVRVFDVIDVGGKTIGLFYADYYHRENKRGGAWMDAFVSQSRLRGHQPVVVNCMNIPQPAPGTPTLLTLDEVTTMFHELGHGVHGLFSSVEYPLLSGTNVPRDYVEFPSTVHEDWAIDPEILAHYARHYQTGQTIPKDLLAKAIAASKFNKGYETLEYMAAALVDLGWHSLTEEQIPSDVESFEKELLNRFGVDFAPVPPRYRSSYFAHVWSGGYSAGYYAYLWSEVLAADAFAAWKERGGLKQSNGQDFRKAILSRGDSRDVMQQYIDFRGQKPTVDALLIRRGLK
ncbi:MAG: M3 family metallopeptidase [Planctomycetes bacterium]|nr:M3 family metallopeptidase [Planctomycetota bacterium]